jgi:poly-gamma-glutamate synthesis protein (capsule biosynthesis protein)
MSLRMILTGDVNLMNVTDPKAPFGQLVDELRQADAVFSNLECCLVETPAGHSVSNEGFFADPAVGGEALKLAGIHAVGIANNVHYGDRNIEASIARLDQLDILHAGAGANVAEARAAVILERSALRLSAAQLGLLADQSRGAQGRGRHRRHSRAHRLPRPDVQDPRGGAASQPAGHSA